MSACSSRMVVLRIECGHCHLRLRSVIARKVSRSKHESPGTPTNLCEIMMICLIVTEGSEMKRTKDPDQSTTALARRQNL